MWPKVSVMSVRRATLLVVVPVLPPYVKVLGTVRRTPTLNAGLPTTCCRVVYVYLSIPVSREYALTDRWYKSATAVTDDAGKLVQWQPKELN